jgi:L-seryl-tRNA(Ser) seleniumtransferase
VPNVYEQIGVPPIINAYGPTTRLSGAILRPEVASAMAEATQYCVDIAQLQGKAGELIAEITGAEAGFITAGAAAGILLATAAAMAGLDPAAMDRLPDARGLRHEVIIPRSHRNAYDHAIRGAGATLVEVGISDRFSGAGVRDVEAWEIAAAISERTAAIYYLAKPHAEPLLGEVVDVAREAGIPVIVDAAAELPPVENLRRFVDEGADLVLFSGGKAIGGPQASGILAGRRELVMSAFLQHIDLDVFFDLWEPPPFLIDKSRLGGLPHNGVGRPCKVGKEQIVGLMTALRLFAQEGPGFHAAAWTASIDVLASGLSMLTGVEIELVADPRQTGIPMLEMRVDPIRAGRSALMLARDLAQGDPVIEVNPSRAGDGILLFSPVCLRAGEAMAIVERIQALMEYPA